MKNLTRTLFLFLLALSVSLTAMAQDQNNDPSMMQEDMSSEADGPTYKEPKDMWEIAPHFGIIFTGTDVPGNIGFGGGLSIRKSLDHVFSLRLDGLYATFSGETDDEFASDNGFNREYSNNWISASLLGVISLNNIHFDIRDKKVDIYALLGGGLNWYEVTDVGSDPRQREVESEMDQHVDFGGGLAFKLGRRVNLGLESRMLVAFGNRADLLDGINTVRTGFTPFRDVISYTNLRVNINIGNFNRRTEPKNWTNGMDIVYNEIDQLKEEVAAQRISDSDGDGVIDRFDEEPGTEEGAMVDTHGRTLDSDGDGIPDHQDAEPYVTPRPGQRVGSDGRVIVPPGLTREDVQQQIDESLAELDLDPDVFLPMVHFNLNSSTIRYADYGTLSGVAKLMRRDEDLEIVVLGYTDQTGSEDYNRQLSYDRAKAVVDHLVGLGVDRDRLILQYGGQGDQLVPENQTYMNRRVELSVAEEGDEEMDPPN